MYVELGSGLLELRQDVSGQATYHFGSSDCGDGNERAACQEALKIGVIGLP
jgi:hypothetical protein